VRRSAQLLGVVSHGVRGVGRLVDAGFPFGGGRRGPGAGAGRGVREEGVDGGLQGAAGAGPGGGSAHAGQAGRRRGRRQRRIAARARPARRRRLLLGARLGGGPQAVERVFCWHGRKAIQNLFFATPNEDLVATLMLSTLHYCSTHNNYNFHLFDLSSNSPKRQVALPTLALVKLTSFVITP